MLKQRKKEDGLDCSTIVQIEQFSEQLTELFNYQFQGSSYHKDYHSGHHHIGAVHNS